MFYTRKKVKELLRQQSIITQGDILDLLIAKEKRRVEQGKQKRHQSSIAVINKLIMEQAHVNTRD